MAVVWTILKAIGIVLLVVLCVLLTVLLLVLLVPVRYRAQGSLREKLCGDAEVSWLFRLLSVRASFDDGFSMCVRLAGIPLFPKREKAQKRRSEKGQKEALSGQEKDVEVKEADTGKDREAAQKQPYPSVQETEQDTAGRVEEENGQEEPPPDGFFGFPECLLEKIYAIFRNCGKKYESICAKIEQVRKILARYIAILRREETKRLASLTLGQLMRMLRHVFPGKMRICLCIGTGDPASTGQILAVQGMLYPVLGQRLEIVPDFKEKHFEGTFFMRGHVTVIVLLLCALRILLNRNFRTLVRLMRKKEEA